MWDVSLLLLLGHQIGRSVCGALDGLRRCVTIRAFCLGQRLCHERRNGRHVIYDGDLASQTLVLVLPDHVRRQGCDTHHLESHIGIPSCKLAGRAVNPGPFAGGLGGLQDPLDCRLQLRREVSFNGMANIVA